jgi:hypothetical protein
MAEAIGLTSGLLTLAAFAFKSSVALYQTVQGIENHPDAVQDLVRELEALQGALRSLTETVGATKDADLSALNLPLMRCGNACHDFEQKLLSCVSRSGSVRANFRGWARLRYLGDDVDNFRRMLAGYKSTILIAITDVTLYVFLRLPCVHCPYMYLQERDGLTPCLQLAVNPPLLARNLNSTKR